MSGRRRSERLKQKHTSLPISAALDPTSHSLSAAPDIKVPAGPTDSSVPPHSDTLTLSPAPVRRTTTPYTTDIFQSSAPLQLTQMSKHTTTSSYPFASDRSASASVATAPTTYARAHPNQPDATSHTSRMSLANTSPPPSSSMSVDQIPSSSPSQIFPRKRPTPSSDIDNESISSDKMDSDFESNLESSIALEFIHRNRNPRPEFAAVPISQPDTTIPTLHTIGQSISNLHDKLDAITASSKTYNDTTSHRLHLLESKLDTLIDHHAVTTQHLLRFLSKLSDFDSTIDNIRDTNKQIHTLLQNQPDFETQFSSILDV